MKLYVDAQCTSPYAMSASVAWHEAGMPFDLGPEDLAAREHRGAGFAARSPTLHRPLLDAGDFRLASQLRASLVPARASRRAGGVIHFQTPKTR